MATEETLRAQRIVLEMAQRRAAGERISDDEVLLKYPEMAEALRKQMGRMRFLESASSEESVRGAPIDTISADSEGPFIDFDSHTLVGESANHYSPGDDARFDSGGLRVTRCEEDIGELLRTTDVLAETSSTLGMVPNAEVRRTSPARLFRPQHRKPMGVIKIYHDNQQTYELFAMRGDEITIGRNDTNEIVIAEDYRMSGRHARIERREVDSEFQFVLIDDGSTNGSFVRVDKARLKSGDELLMGAERYQFLTSPNTHLKHVLPSRNGASMLIRTGQWLGREFDDGLDAFKNDAMLDPRHAQIHEIASGQWLIQDGKSLNGTWMRIQEVPLVSRCNFQLGEQRFGFVG